jgi:hypothetical protein
MIKCLADDCFDDFRVQSGELDSEILNLIEEIKPTSIKKLV